MKKSELRQIIKEEIKTVIQEGAEELKAYDAIKGAMFKIKKALEPVLDKAKAANIIKQYKINIRPYNGGLELQTNIKPNFERDVIEKNSEFSHILSNLYGIYIQPKTFFQSDIDDGLNPWIEYKSFKIDKNDKEFGKKIVPRKDNIKKVIDEIMKEILARIDTLNKMV